MNAPDGEPTIKGVPPKKPDRNPPPPERPIRGRVAQRSTAATMKEKLAGFIADSDVRVVIDDFVAHGDIDRGHEAAKENATGHFYEVIDAAKRANSNIQLGRPDPLQLTEVPEVLIGVMKFEAGEGERPADYKKIPMFTAIVEYVSAPGRGDVDRDYIEGLATIVLQHKDENIDIAGNVASNIIRLMDRHSLRDSVDPDVVDKLYDITYSWLVRKNDAYDQRAEKIKSKYSQVYMILNTVKVSRGEAAQIETDIRSQAGAMGWNEADIATEVASRIEDRRVQLRGELENMFNTLFDDPLAHDVPHRGTSRLDELGFQLTDSLAQYRSSGLLSDDNVDKFNELAISIIQELKLLDEEFATFLEAYHSVVGEPQKEWILEDEAETRRRPEFEKKWEKLLERDKAIGILRIAQESGVVFSEQQQEIVVAIQHRELFLGLAMNYKRLYGPQGGQVWVDNLMEDIEGVCSTILAKAAQEPNHFFGEAFNQLYEGRLLRYVLSQVHQMGPVLSEVEFFQKEYDVHGYRPFTRAGDYETEVEMALQPKPLFARQVVDKMPLHRIVSDVLHRHLLELKEMTQILHDSGRIVDEGIGWVELKKYIDRLNAEEVDELHLRRPNFTLACQCVTEAQQDFLAHRNHIITPDFGKPLSADSFLDAIQQDALERMMVLAERRMVPTRVDGRLVLRPQPYEVFRRQMLDEVRRAFCLKKSGDGEFFGLALTSQLLVGYDVVWKEGSFDKETAEPIDPQVERVTVSHHYLGSFSKAVEHMLTAIQPFLTYKRFSLPRAATLIPHIPIPRDMANYRGWLSEKFSVFKVQRLMEWKEDAMFRGRTNELADVEDEYETLEEGSIKYMIDRFIRGGWRNWHFQDYFIRSRKKETDPVTGQTTEKKTAKVDFARTIANLRRIGPYIVFHYIDHAIDVDKEKGYVCRGDQLHMIIDETYAGGITSAMTERHSELKQLSSRTPDEAQEYQDLSSAIQTNRTMVARYDQLSRISEARRTASQNAEIYQLSHQLDFQKTITRYKQLAKIKKRTRGQSREFGKVSGKLKAYLYEQEITEHYRLRRPDKYYRMIRTDATMRQEIEDQIALRQGLWLMLRQDGLQADSSYQQGSIGALLEDGIINLPFVDQVLMPLMMSSISIATRAVAMQKKQEYMQSGTDPYSRDHTILDYHLTPEMIFGNSQDARRVQLRILSYLRGARKKSISDDDGHLMSFASVYPQGGEDVVLALCQRFFERTQQLLDPAQTPVYARYYKDTKTGRWREKHRTSLPARYAEFLAKRMKHIHHLIGGDDIDYAALLEQDGGRRLQSRAMTETAGQEETGKGIRKWLFDLIPKLGQRGDRMGAPAVGQTLGKVIKEIADPIEGVDHGWAQEIKTKLVAWNLRIFTPDWNMRQSIFGTWRREWVKGKHHRACSIIEHMFPRSRTFPDTFIPGSSELETMGREMVYEAEIDYRERWRTKEYHNPQASNTERIVWLSEKLKRLPLIGPKVSKALKNVVEEYQQNDEFQASVNKWAGRLQNLPVFGDFFGEWKDIVPTKVENKYCAVDALRSCGLIVREPKDVWTVLYEQWPAMAAAGIIAIVAFIILALRGRKKDQN